MWLGHKSGPSHDIRWRHNSMCTPSSLGIAPEQGYDGDDLIITPEYVATITPRWRRHINQLKQKKQIPPIDDPIMGIAFFASCDASIPRLELRDKATWPDHLGHGWQCWCFDIAWNLISPTGWMKTDGVGFDGIQQLSHMCVSLPS